MKAWLLLLLAPLMLGAQSQTLVGKRFSSVAVFPNDATANAACFGGLCDPGKWYMVTATGLMRVVPPAGPAGTFVAWPGSGSGGSSAYPSITDYGCVEGDSSANAAANDACWTAAITALEAAHGGTLYFPAGTWHFSAQWTFPTATGPGGATLPSIQKSWQLLGAAGCSNGQGGTPTGGTIVKNAYAGAEAKLLTLGLGKLTIRDMCFIEPGSSTTPFFKTTSTTILADSIGVYGNCTGQGCAQDVFILGGNNTAVAEDDPNAAFQGYGTTVSNSFFDKVRRLARLGVYADSIYFTNNTMWSHTGSNTTTAITAATNASAAVLTSAAHGLPICTVTGPNCLNGAATTWQLVFTGGTGSWAALNGARAVTPIDANTFSVPIDSTGFGALAGSLAYYSGAAVESYGDAGSVDTGNVWLGNRFESNSYPYIFKMQNIGRNFFLNTVHDGAAANITAIYRLESGAGNNTVFQMYNPGSARYWLDTSGTNKLIANDASQPSIIPNNEIRSGGFVTYQNGASQGSFIQDTAGTRWHNYIIPANSQYYWARTPSGGAQEDMMQLWRSSATDYRLRLLSTSVNGFHAPNGDMSFEAKSGGLITMANANNQIGFGNTPVYRYHFRGTPTSTVFLAASPTSLASGDQVGYFNMPAVTGSVTALNMFGAMTGNLDAILKNSNSSSTTAHARFEVSAGGTGGGDPTIIWTVPGALNATMGLDNSDNDKLKICPGVGPSNCTVPGITMETTGATAGNVGINTATPTQKLHVAAGTNDGVLIVSDNTGGGSQLQMRGATNTNNQFYLGFDTTSNYAGLQAITQGVATRQIALNPQGGNVNINTATVPATGTALNVRASTADGTTNAQRWEDSGGTEIAKLTSNGNLTVANRLTYIGPAATPTLRLSHTAGTGNYADLLFGGGLTGLRAYTSDDQLRFYLSGSNMLNIATTRVDVTPPIYSAAFNLLSNNTYFKGKTTINTESALIGTNASDKVSIDPSGVGAVFGGAITVTGCTGCGAGGGMTNPMTTAEDLIKGGASGAPARLAVGAEGTVLKVTGGVVGWGTDSTGSPTIASGTATLGTSAVASGACATVVTVAATGVLTTDVINFTPNVDITAVTGYTPVTSGGLVIHPYPTAGNVNFKVCNLSVASITPGAVTLNWRVAR